MKLQEKIRGLFISAVILSAIAAVIYFPTQLGLDLQGGSRLILEAQDTEDITVNHDAVMGAIAVIRNRIDSLGVSEPVIGKKGLRQIVVELPGIKDPDRAIRLIGETAQLSFVEAEFAPENADTLSPEQVARLAGKDARLYTYSKETPDGSGYRRSLFLKKSVVGGASLTEVHPANDQNGRPVVSIEFDKEGTKAFADITRKSIGKPLAIILDGKVISAPTIQVAITDGRAQITGLSITEMKDLVIKLKAGALPVPVEIISNKVVGPTLGRDSIEKSKKAGLIGFALVCLVMMLFYRLPGFLASIALLLFLVLSLACLKLFQATLTLPGIAGLILTMGMAVDANVIIFERIKEELRGGHDLRIAIHTGFARAFTAILDANVTTLIAAFVLFWLGTGSIKGFAVTLSIGIIVSMFSAIFITRSLLQVASRMSISDTAFFKVSQLTEEGKS